MSALTKKSVERVRKVLADAGLDDNVVELAATARSAEDAAASVGCPLGAIVKSLVFAIDGQLVMALVAGDHQCIESALAPAFNLQGKVRRPQAAEVKDGTGFTIGGIPPIGLTGKLPVVIDRSLKRFETIYAAAGHPHCVFASNVATLRGLTDGLISAAVAAPLEPGSVAPVQLKASRSFRENRQARARG